MDNFRKDLKQEQYLTNIFYDLLFKNYLNIKGNYETQLIDFNENPNLQYKGADIIVNTPNNIEYIDIKTQTNNYINNPTPTFCLEITCKINGEITIGWFLKEDNLTTYYVFVWIHQADFNGNIITNLDELKKVEFMFVKVQDIKDYLNNYGITSDFMKEMADYIRQNNLDEYITKVKNQSFKFKLTKKSNIPEHPINLIIHKNIYANLPNTYTYMYENGQIKCINSPKIRQK